MKQRTETNEVFEEFSKAKAEGSQPVCPYCHKPLEIGQFHSVYVQWTWNNKTKRYERDEPDLNAEEPFCKACRAEYLDSLYR